MEAPKIFESEYRFCLILWDNEPVSSGKLEGKRRIIRKVYNLKE